MRCRKTYILILEISIGQNYFEKKQIIIFYLLAVNVTGTNRQCTGAAAGSRGAAGGAAGTDSSGISAP